MSLLDTIAAASRQRIAERRARVPLVEVRRRAADAPPSRSLHDALASRPFSVIAEYKRRSPSGGVMDAGNLEAAVPLYEATPWISAISVITDQDHFDGSIERLEAIRNATSKPILRKDFLIDEYQVWEARAHGADAILLMAALHHGNATRMNELYEAAREAGLDVLVEVGMEEEVSIEELAAIVPPRARIWGVNARRFVGRSGLQVRVRLSRWLSGLTRRDLLADPRQHRRLRRVIPKGKLAVAESGIRRASELAETREAGYDAALIGTAFVKGPRRAEDVAAELGSVFPGPAQQEAASAR